MMVSDSNGRLTRTTYSCPFVSCKSATCTLGLYGGMNGSYFFPASPQCIARPASAARGIVLRVCASGIDNG